MLDGGNWIGPDAGEPYAPTLVPRTPPWTSGDFMRALHPPGSRGKVSLLAKSGGASFARCFPADEIEPVLPVWTETTSYVGLNRYFGPRGGKRPIAELTCLYADLDTYRRPDLMALAPDVVAETILGRIGALGLPEPSFLVDSGRGFYAIWLIEPLPRGALPRWQEAQRCLVGLLAPLGADPACCDAARVLRIPETLNGKSGRAVTVVRGDGTRHAFDGLATAYTRRPGDPRAPRSRPATARQGRTSREVSAACRPKRGSPPC